MWSQFTKNFLKVSNALLFQVIQMSVSHQIFFLKASIRADILSTGLVRKFIQLVAILLLQIGKNCLFYITRKILKNMAKVKKKFKADTFLIKHPVYSLIN